METLLVISNEPALAETLASELDGFTVTGTSPADAEKHVHNENFSLIVIDSDVNYIINGKTKNSITLTRPVRLSDAVYTIKQNVKSKTIPIRQEREIVPGYVFNGAEKLIRNTENTETVSLTDKEAELLEQLTSSTGSTLTRDTLLKNVWGYGEDINTHTLETHIYRLRGKLKQLSEDLDINFSEEGGYYLKS